MSNCKRLKFDLQLFDNEYIVGTEGNDNLSSSGNWGYYATVNAGAGDDVIHNNYNDQVFILAGTGNDSVDNYGGGVERSMRDRATTPFTITGIAVMILLMQFRSTAARAMISSPIFITATTRRSSAERAMTPSKTETTLRTL